MILGGAVAGQGETSVILTIGIVWVCAAAGDSVSFLLGRRLGRGFILRNGPRVRITHERFARVEDYFSRHGGKTILIGRFIGLVRALAPFVAGSSAMRYTNFLPYSVLGTGLWSAGYVLIGYFASRSLDAAAHAAGQGTLFFGIAVVAIVAIVWAVRFLRDPANRAPAGRGHGASALSFGPWWRSGAGSSRRRGSYSSGSPPAGSGSSSRRWWRCWRCRCTSWSPTRRRSRLTRGQPRGTRRRWTSWTSCRWRGSSQLAKVVTALGSSAVVIPLAAIALRLPRVGAAVAGGGGARGRDGDHLHRGRGAEGADRSAAPARSAGGQQRLRASRAVTPPTRCSIRGWR